MDDSALQSLVAETPPECILSIEDIDCAFPEPRRSEDIEAEEDKFEEERAAQRRARQEDAQAQGVELLDDVLDMDGDFSMPPRTSDVTLSGLLNLIDGVWSEEGRLLFATVTDSRFLKRTESADRHCADEPHREARPRTHPPWAHRR